MHKSNLYKGLLEPIIMHLLKQNGRMYGYEITQQVKGLTKGELQITEGALYPLLHRLEAEGLLEAEIENIGNRVRKYYLLTPLGKQQTKTALVELQTFLTTIQTLLNPKPAFHAQ